MRKMTQKAFIAQSSIPAPLIRAVVRQVGGWDHFREMAQDVASYGADGGFSGFVYYSDTIPFAKRQRANIAELLERYAEDFGCGVLNMVQGWRCMEGAEARDIALAMYGRGDDTQVLNGFAWFALEEVCRDFVNASEGA